MLPTAGNLRPPSAGELPAGSASAQYNAAFGLLKQADYPAAEEALKTFIAQHPKDPLAGSAQYWLGETYYARGRYAEAASAFAEGYKNYPKGTKAADDLLKLGMSLAPRQPEAERLRGVRPAGSRLPQPGKLDQRALGRREEAARLLTRGLTATPLSLGEFTASLASIARFESSPFLAVAVSGGPDSLALAILADRWARERGGQICALTVDHRLRPESADETRRLAAWLSARAIRHEVLVWAGEKPRTGIQEAARFARYRLLGGWCRDHACLHLLTGHHRDDQIETHLIRRRAHSGPDGLAGMSAIRELADCRLLRPLLGVAKGSARRIPRS